MKRRICIGAMAAIWCLATISQTTVMAAGPLSDKVNSGYDEETWTRLQDHVLEYDEIPNLVHEYNRSISDTWEQLEEARKALLEDAEELESQKFRMKNLKDSAAKNGEAAEMMNYAVQEMTLDAVAKGMRKGANQMVGKTTAASIQRGENQMIKGAQSLMIAYDSARKQKDIMLKLEELYREQYRLAVNKLGQGMATEAEMLKAENNQLSAQKNIQSIDGGLAKMMPTLCTLTGWPADSNPEIASIPKVDLSRIDHMNLEADTKKAIGNNTALIEQRRSERAKTNGGQKARDAMIEEGDQKMTIEMKRLYDDVFAKKTAYEAALAGYQSAQLNKDKYDRMYQMNMLGKSDYLGAQIAYYQKKAACESADTALLLAIETYEWAVKGLASLDGE